MIRIDHGALAIINELITLDVLCCWPLCYSQNHKQFFSGQAKRFVYFCRRRFEIRSFALNEMSNTKRRFSIRSNFI